MVSLSRKTILITKTVSVFALFFLRVVAFADCRVALADDWEKSRKSLVQEYHRISPRWTVEGQNLPVALIHEVSASKNSEAVFLLHGFMGSPQEMRPLALRAHEQGYDVFNDLILGFGGNAHIANQFHRDEWFANVEARLIEVFNCYKKVHLVGFSTGGLLLHRFLYEHPLFSARATISFYSPFFEPHSAFLNVLGRSIGDIDIELSVSAVYSASQHPDLVALLKQPQFYLQQIPLTAANQVFELGREMVISQRRVPYHLRSPMKLFMSQGDQIAKIDSTMMMMSVYGSSQVKIYPAPVPHHLMVGSVSSVAEEVLQQTLDFIQLN